MTDLPAGTYTLTAKYTAGNMTEASANVFFTIEKAPITPTVSISGWTYGQGANAPAVEGNLGNASVTFEYKVQGADDNTYTQNVPTNAGNYTVRATVPESDNYLGDVATTNFTIEKADVVYTAPTANNGLIYNRNAQALITAGSATGGTMQYKLGVDGDWTTEIPTVPNAGEYTVYYKVVGDGNHNDVAETPITVTVTPVTPFVETPPIASAITYGDTLSMSQLTNGVVQYSNTDSTVVAGSFAWKDGSEKPFVSDSNSTTYTVVFTPADTTNYNTVETAITLTVNKAENAPNMPDNTISAPYSNMTVGAVTLPAGWAWQDAEKDKALGVGVSENAIAVYTGTDKGNYENETVEITITRSDCEHVESDILYTGDGEKEPTCTEAGIGHTECTKCNEVMQSSLEVDATGHNGGTATCKDKAECATCHEKYGEIDKNNHVGETEVKDAKEATCGAEGYTGDTYCKACGTKTADGTKTEKLTTHTWDEGVVTKEATTTEKGEKTYTCSVCKTTRVEEIPVIATKPEDNTQSGDNTKPGDNTEPTGYDTTEETEKTIISANTDKGDVKGSTFAALQLKAVGNNKSVKLTWKKVKDADGYILYAAQCGKKLKKLKTFTGASEVKYTHKKLKKAKFYKYMVVAYKNMDGKQYTIATSKTVHAVTDGGKYANPANVTVKASKLSIKKGAKKTIKASYKLPKNKKLKVNLAKFRYESDNTKVATVTSKGVVKGKKKGTANIYVYAQNGVYKKVKVTVK